MVIYQNTERGIEERMALGYPIGTTGTNNIAELIAFIIGVEKINGMVIKYMEDEGLQ